MFEDYYYDNPQLQGLLAAAAGGPIMDTPRQAAVMPMTQQAVAPLSYEALADRRAAANTPPPGTPIVGPYAGDKGLSFGDDNTFDIYDEQEVRVVDGKGNVIFSGVGAEGANRAVAVAQSLSDDLGKNANFKVQKAERTIIDGSVGPNRYIDVAYAAPSQSGLGFLADNVLPFAASFIPVIGPVAGAALGSAVSSGLQGRSLKDALTRAAIAGGSAYAGGQLFGPATSGASAPMTGVNADLIPNALQGLNFGSLTSAAIPAAVGGAAGDILVNAATRAATSAVPSILASTAGNVIGQAALSQASQSPPAEQPSTTEPQEIVVTAPKSYLSPESLAGIMATFGGAALPPMQSFPQQPTTTEPTDDEILVEARKSFLSPEALAAVMASGAPTSLLPDNFFEPPSDNKFNFKDVLGTGLSVPQLLSIGGVGADLLGSLIGGGGGGTGTGSPYVSPFGTGAGFAPRQDMRANPNILDYERYGFGPEAMFFKPEYSGLLPANAAPAQAPPAMTINPAYMPLI